MEGGLLEVLSFQHGTGRFCCFGRVGEACGRVPMHPFTSEQGWGGFLGPSGHRILLCPRGGRSAVTERAPGALPNLDSDAMAPHAQASPGVGHQLSLRKETTSQFGRLAYQLMSELRQLSDKFRPHYVSV